MAASLPGKVGRTVPSCELEVQWGPASDVTLPAVKALPACLHADSFTSSLSPASFRLPGCAQARHSHPETALFTSLPKLTIVLGYRDVIIVLPQDASPEVVADTINASLADEAGLQRKAARALHLGLEHFTCHKKAERILDAVDEFRGGFRGFKWPYGFRSGCQNYHFYHQPGLALNPWCPGRRPLREERESRV